MTIWLFYKITPTKEGAQVEFRRLESRQVSDCLPDELRGITTIPAGEDTEQFVKTLVRKSGWVGEIARSASAELGRRALNGRW